MLSNLIRLTSPDCINALVCHLIREHLLRAIYSTPLAKDVTAYVEATYPVGRVARCQLLNRGYNDVFEIGTETSERYVIRFSGRRLRGIDNTAYETAFVSHLAAAGVPVATPVRSRRGNLVERSVHAEGARPTVMFRFVEGERAGEIDHAYAHAQGATLARIHNHSTGYDGPDSALSLDLDHLLWRPLNALNAHPAATPEACREFEGLAQRLSARVQAARAELSWVHCHGDCHGFNARITRSADGQTSATFFDFDDGGPGWLAYDVAVFLWLTTLNPDRSVLWPSFLAGYRSERPLLPADLDAIPLFVPIRHIWLMGDWAAKIDEWGADHLSTDWFARQLDRLRNWEDRHLSAPRLL